MSNVYDLLRLPLHILRRDLLKLVPTVASGHLVRAGAAMVDSREPHIIFPTAPRDRLAVTSYPFRTYIESPTNRDRKTSVPGMDMKEFPGFVLQRFGVRNINPLGVHFASTDDAYLGAFRDAVAKTGSHVVDFGLGGAPFYDSEAATRDRALASSRKWIDIAAKAGSPSVRQHLQVRPGQKPQLAPAAESLSRLAEYGAKRNIVVNLENDNAVAEDPFLLAAIIEKVNNPYLRALPDFGNSLIGHDAEFNKRAVDAMLGHVWNICHVKDTVQNENHQLQTVDLAKMFQIAKQHSYRGYYSMEFDTDAGDPIAGTQKLIQTTLKYLS